MKLKNQLLAGFAAVIGVFVLAMVVVGVYLNSLVNTVTTIKEDTLPFVLALDEMDLNRSEVQQFLTDVSATHDQAAFKRRMKPQKLHGQRGQVPRQIPHREQHAGAGSN
jgi:hypothetical protein